LQIIRYDRQKDNTPYRLWKVTKNAPKDHRAKRIHHIVEKVYSLREV